MSSPDPLFSSLGLDRLIAGGGFEREPGGRLAEGGSPVVCAPREFIRSFRFVLEKESAGAWKGVLKGSGRATGKAVAAEWDRALAERGQQALSALPLEACLRLIERYFAAQGWGCLKIDLSEAAQHGLVIAHLEHSSFVEALSDVHDFVDPLFAGVLQGFFEHISGQALGGEEIACVRRGAVRCTFVVTAAERLESIAPLLGHETAETIVARLKT